MNDDSKTTLTENQTVPEQELKAGTDETNALETTTTEIKPVETVSRTLALIKPDAMQANNKNAILEIIKGNGFNIVQERELQLSREKAGLFYKEHEGKLFYEDLTQWMSSAPIYALVLEKKDAVQSWRLLMGPTDSNKARDIEPNSVRALFGTDGSHNATHGSDSLTSAEREINIIFNQQDEQLHVTEVQDMDNKFNTHDVCKPDAVPEDIKTTDENKDIVQAQKTEKSNATADVEHLNTADLVTSLDQVTNLLDQDTKQEHSKPQDTQNITQGNLDQVATNEAIAEPNVTVVTPAIVENDCSNTSVETEIKQDNSNETGIKKDASIEAEIKQDASIETDVKKDSSVEAEIKKDASVEADANKDVSVEAEAKKDGSIETEIKEDASVKDDTKKDVSVESDIKKEDSTESGIKEDISIETKKVVFVETEVKNDAIIDTGKLDKLENAIIPATKDNEVSDDCTAVGAVEPVVITVEKTVSAENEAKEEKKDIVDVNFKNVDSEDQIQKHELPVDKTEKSLVKNTADKDEKTTANNTVDENKKTAVDNTADIVEPAKVTIQSVEVDIKDKYVESNEKKTQHDVQKPDQVSPAVEETKAPVEDSIVSNAEIINKEDDVVVDDAVVSVEEKNTVVINSKVTETATHDTIQIVEKETVIDNTDEKHQQESVCKAVGSETSVTEETNSAPVVSFDVDVDVAVADELEDVDLAAKATDKKEEQPTPNQDKAADTIVEKKIAVEEKEGLDTKESDLNNENDVDDKTNKQVVEEPKLEVSDPIRAPESILAGTSNEEPEVKENVINDSQSKIEHDEVKVEDSVASTTPADTLSSSSMISEEESISGTQGSEDNKENDDHVTSSSASSAAESLQSSENSSVTKVGALEDQVKEKKTKNSAAVNDKKKLRAPAASGLRTTSVADKKKATTAHPTTKTKLASSTLVKKKVPIKAEDASKESEEKPKTVTKAGRVPRVALLATQPAKKKATTAEATTEEKPKKATSTRSLVSRLTAPTAASARKKTSADATTTTTTTATATVRTKKPADPNQKKTSSAPLVKKNPASTIGSRVTATKPSHHSSELKPKPPSTTVRRTSPPTSTATATSKKTTVAPTKRASKTVVTTATGTRVAASGLSSTQAKSRKETSSIATTKKATTVAHKKPATALKKKDGVSPPNEKVNTKKSAVKGDEDHSAEVLDDQKEIQQLADEVEEIKSTIVTEVDEKKCEESSNNSHAEEEDQEEKSTTEQVATVAEEVATVTEEVAIVAEEVSVSKEDDITITKQVEQKQSTLETIEEKVVVTEPEQVEVAVEKEVESVIVNQPKEAIANQPKQAEHQTNNNASSDAEVAAITQTNITNNKPQMASLRSRFENLNNNINNINQLHTTPSKEIRSKSPNKISDMINRFTAN